MVMRGTPPAGRMCAYASGTALLAPNDGFAFYNLESAVGVTAVVLAPPRAPVASGAAAIRVHFLCENPLIGCGECDFWLSLADNES